MMTPFSFYDEFSCECHDCPSQCRPLFEFLINDNGYECLALYNIKSDWTRKALIPLTMVCTYLWGISTVNMDSRLQNLLGPFLFTFSWSSTIIISMVSLFVYIPDTSMKISFVVLSIGYVVSVIIFLANIDENIFTFLFSTTNWKQTLGEELWDVALHSSHKWGIPELIGDHDANHGAHVAFYRTCDLPWKKIKEWLRSKKDDFLESPPVWMTPRWFDDLPVEVKRDIWTGEGELERLINKVKEVCPEVRVNSN